MSFSAFASTTKDVPLDKYPNGVIRSFLDRGFTLSEWNRIKSYLRFRPPLGRVVPVAPEGESVLIHLRTTKARRKAYLRAAAAERKKLSQWCYEHLDKAAGFKE